MFASRSFRTPFPEIFGLGSSIPITTRLTFLSISRIAHGTLGWLRVVHGSSVV